MRINHRLGSDCISGAVLDRFDKERETNASVGGFLSEGWLG